MIEDVLALPDGRRVGFGVYGNPGGRPLYCLHGTPGSRLEAALIAEYTARSDVCFVGIDRPGYGRSTFQRSRGVSDFPEDLRAVAEYLGHARLAVLGYSGGGPFALACAYRVPERLSAVGIISGVGPARVGAAGMHEANRQKFNLAQRIPWLARWLIRLAFTGKTRSAAKLAKMLETVWAQMPAPDQAVLADERFREWMVRETMDALAGGTAGFAHEEVLMAQPWGFEPRQVRHPNVHLWHGCLDKNVPAAMAREVAGQLPGCRARFFEDEGHLSVIYHYGGEMIANLLSA